jgi:hypothetical protein
MRGYKYSIPRHKFSRIVQPRRRDPGREDPTAAGINNHGTVAGFYSTRGGKTEASS